MELVGHLQLQHQAEPVDHRRPASVRWFVQAERVVLVVGPVMAAAVVVAVPVMMAQEIMDHPIAEVQVALADQVTADL